MASCKVQQMVALQQVLYTTMSLTSVDAFVTCNLLLITYFNLSQTKQYLSPVAPPTAAKGPGK
jgi:hypothetical protein